MPEAVSPNHFDIKKKLEFKKNTCVLEQSRGLILQITTFQRIQNSFSSTL